MITTTECNCDGKCRINGNGNIISYGNGRYEILQTRQGGYAVCDREDIDLGIYSYHGHIVEEFCGLDSAKKFINELDYKLTKLHNPKYYL